MSLVVNHVWHEAEIHEMRMLGMGLSVCFSGVGSLCLESKLWLCLKSFDIPYWNLPSFWNMMGSIHIILKMRWFLCSRMAPGNSKVSMHTTISLRIIFHTCSLAPDPHLPRASWFFGSRLCSSEKPSLACWKNPEFFLLKDRAKWSKMVKIS